MHFWGAHPRHTLLAALLLVSTVFAWAQEPQPTVRPDANNGLVLNREAVEQSIWAAAKPYLDYSDSDLQLAVPELKGLQPDLDQEQLGSILDRTGDKCLDLLQRSLNIITSEEVITQRSHGKKRRQEFDYLLLSRKTPRGIVLEEHRTHKYGGAAMDEADGAPYAQGFASMWVQLFPGNRSESRFRYLGQQDIDNHHTFVVGFAQIPGSVKLPGKFFLQGMYISVLYQGIAWINASDFRVVRMREDLLAPRPDAYLTQFTAEVRFDEVQIARASSPLWLPREAIVDWEFKGRFVQQRHLYSHYRLYTVRTKVLPSVL